jgi:hypothetical protein
MSFNRPSYLSQVLDTLLLQEGLADRPIYLFQDGALSMSGEPLVSKEPIEECKRLFQQKVPNGRVLGSEQNLGVARNFDRAERLFFKELGAEAAYFFEDDLCLSPYYLPSLDILIQFAFDEPRIAYVAAYGEHKATLEQQQAEHTRLVMMKHKWGFGLTRRQWLRQADIMSPYLDLVSKKDYRDRDHQAIKQYFRELGYASTGTSQDSMKDVASAVLGTTKVMTFACFGKYIGEVGLHSHKAIYDKEGYASTVLFDSRIDDFKAPTGQDLDKWIGHSRNFAKMVLSEQTC